MTIPTRKKQLKVGKPNRPVSEFEVGKMVKVVCVRPLKEGTRMQWRQKKRTIEIRPPYSGLLDVEYHLMEKVTVGAYYPFK